MSELYFLRCHQSSCHTPQNHLGIVLDSTAGINMFFNFSGVKGVLINWQKQRKNIQDAGMLFSETLLRANLSYPWLSIRSKVCTHTQTHPSF